MEHLAAVFTLHGASEHATHVMATGYDDQVYHSIESNYRHSRKSRIQMWVRRHDDMLGPQANDHAQAALCMFHHIDCTLRWEV